MSAKEALLKHHAKQLNVGKKTRKNEKPERETVKSCMRWFNENGFSMNIVEAKAVYHPEAGRYIKGQVAPGFLDSAGCTPDGIGAFVEFKAPGKLSTLRTSQREFIKEKVYRGCFSCVVDCVERLQEIYRKWNHLKSKDREQAIAYLLDCLPKRKKRPTDSFL